MNWARLLKRVFDIDVDHCPNCGGSLKIIAAIEDPPVIVRILTHLDLPTNQIALASIPIYVVSILPIYLHSTFAYRRIELYGASIDSGAVSQLADPLEAHSESRQRCICRHTFFAGRAREEQGLDPLPTA
jgi:hypothetical protein